MSLLEITLALTSATLAVLLVVAWGLLLGARRRIRQLTRALSTERPRPRLAVPRPADAVRTVVGTAISIKDKGLGGTLRSSIDDLARWADVERPDLARMATADGTVAVLFSDIEGSTALNHELGDGGWVRLLAKHDAVLTRAVGRHGGHVVKSQGDGFMVAFPTSAQAVAAASEVQRRITRARPGSRLAGIAVRIGVHEGSAVHRDGDLFGRNVAYAARVAAEADGGEVLVSDAALQALEVGGDEVPVLESREVDLKGIPGTQLVHALDWKV
jgi:class 3 adenylate cyclase/HAMP domain-containing protein